MAKIKWSTESFLIGVAGGWLAAYVMERYLNVEVRQQPHLIEREVNGRPGDPMMHQGGTQVVAQMPRSSNPDNFVPELVRNGIARLVNSGVRVVKQRFEGGIQYLMQTNDGAKVPIVTVPQQGAVEINAPAFASQLRGMAASLEGAQNG